MNNPSGRRRPTVRRMMTLVALASVATWLATTAVRVRGDADTRWLYHAQADSLDEHAGYNDVGHHAPFWPRYWRRLLGRPWPGSYACDCQWSSAPPGVLAATFAGPGGRKLEDEQRRLWGARQREAFAEARRKAVCHARHSGE